jgi:hypothetical protein
VADKYYFIAQGLTDLSWPRLPRERLSNGQIDQLKEKKVCVNLCGSACPVQFFGKDERSEFNRGGSKNF